MSQELFSVVMRAARAIERDGRMRSQLRRAASASQVWGLAEASKFDSDLRAVLQKLHRSLAGDETVPDECLILISQRNVAAPKAQEYEPREVIPLAALLGGREEADRTLSGLRFQRLMSARPGDDRLRQVRRALSLLKQPAHPVAVVEAYLDLHSHSGARRFANAYFSGQPLPAGRSDADAPSDQGTMS